MASPFQKYQSGIEASTGNLVSAYGQMAQQTSAAISGLGQNLAEGIKSYAKNRDENELLTAKAQGLAGNFEFLTKQIKDNPELAPFAESFNPILSKIGKFETMSKGQKQALLLEAETFQAQIAPALSIFKEGNVARTRQGVQSALDAKPKVTTEMGVEVEALPYQPDKSPDWNFNNNRQYLELTKKNNSKLASLDVEKVLGQFGDGWSNAFAADPNLAKDPKFRDTILRGLSDYKALDTTNVNPDAFSDAYTGATVSPVEMRMRQVQAEKAAADKAAGKTGAPAKTPSSATAQKEYLTAEQKYDKEFKTRTKAVENADAGVEKASAATKAFLDARKGKGSMSDSEGKQYSYLLRQEEKAQKAKEKADKEIEGVSDLEFEDDVRPTNVQAALEVNQDIKVKNIAEKKSIEAERKLLEGYLSDLRGGGYVGISQRLAQAGFGGGRNVEAIYNSIFRDPELQAAIGEGREKGVNTTAPELRRLSGFAQDIGKKRSGDLYDFLEKVRGTQDATLVTGRVRASNRLASEKLIEQRLAELKVEESKFKPKAESATPTSVVAEAEKRAAGITTPAAPKTPQPTYEETLKRPFDYSTKIKTDVKFQRDMTYAEEKEYVRKWFMDNRKGIIPESLDAVYRAVRPETDVRFMDAPDGGQVMITSKGAQYIAPVKAEKGMTDEQISDQTLFRYGTSDGNRIIPEERTKGSGIRLAGFVKGGKKNAEAFQQLHKDTVKIRTIVPQLLAMYKKDKLGRTLIPNDDWGTAKSLLAQLKAAIRVETVGTGPVAIAEHASIEKRVADPTAFLSLDITGKSTLEGLLKSNEMAIINNDAGVQVTLTPTAGDVNATERQARINANKGKR